MCLDFEFKGRKNGGGGGYLFTTVLAVKLSHNTKGLNRTDSFCFSKPILTPDRRQSKTLLKIYERGSKSVGRQMAIKNSVSNDFDLRSSIVLTFSIAAYPV